MINGAKKIEGDGGTKIDVKLAVEYMSFSAHADAKGILQLIRTSQPRHVMFVHGEEAKMEFLKEKLQKEFGLTVYKPANGETVSVATEPEITLDVPTSLLKKSIQLDPHPSKRKCPFHASLVLQNEGGRKLLRVMDPEQAAEELGLPMHTLNFTVTVGLKAKNLKDADPWTWLKKLLNEKFPEATQEESDCDKMSLDGVVDLKLMKKEKGGDLEVSWEYASDVFGSEVMSVLNDVCG